MNASSDSHPISAQHDGTAASLPNASGAAPEANLDKVRKYNVSCTGGRVDKKASKCEMIWLCIFLLLLSGLALAGTYCAIARTNAAALAESTVAWELPPGTHLRLGPSNFHYDPQHKQLSHRGVLTDSTQLQLRDLLEFDPEWDVRGTTKSKTVGFSNAVVGSIGQTTKVKSSKRQVSVIEQSKLSSSPSFVESRATMKSIIISYHSALGLLAYKATELQAKQVQWLLILGSLGGVLGALLRSFVDFVGNACYKDVLDLNRWWPLYVTRPVVGAMLGFLLVVLFKARLFTGGDIQNGSDTYWWLGMAVLGGFSTIDVTSRLRQAAKALFGGEEKKTFSTEATPVKSDQKTA